MDQKLKFGCGLYDRMLPLYTGEVVPEGVALDFVISHSPRELFDSLSREGGFDIAEMSASEYITRFAAGQCPFVALPVFPSRIFRHGFITVNRTSGIRTPKDLEGRRVGIQIYTQTAAVWSRGLLARDYGVDLSAIHWVEGDVDKPGRSGDPYVLPLLKPVDLVPNDSGVSLGELLERGGIDALVSARLPTAFGKNPDIERLFPDSRAVEMDYFRRTGIFPIMHIVVMRRALHDADPSLAPRLFDAFCRSKDQAVAAMKGRGGTLPYMLPWLKSEVEAMEAVFGPDPWPYGVAANRVTLEALVACLCEQDMIAAPMPVEELFVAGRSL